MTAELPPGPCSGGRGLGKSSGWGFVALGGLPRLCVAAQEARKSCVLHSASGWRWERSAGISRNAAPITWPGLAAGPHGVGLPPSGREAHLAFPPAVIINQGCCQQWVVFLHIATLSGCPAVAPGSGSWEEQGVQVIAAVPTMGQVRRTLGQFTGQARVTQRPEMCLSRPSDNLRPLQQPDGNGRHQ